MGLGFMNRREFIKSALIALLPLSLSDSTKEKEVETILEETAHLSDNEFVTYIMIQTRLYIDNPRSCAVIHNIGWEGE